jgi:hypothetical protein
MRPHKYMTQTRQMPPQPAQPGIFDSPRVLGQSDIDTLAAGPTAAF